MKISCLLGSPRQVSNSAAIAARFNEAAAKLGDIIGDRQQLVADALHALALQYPGYAESIRDRQLERAQHCGDWQSRSLGKQLHGKSMGEA